MLIDVSALRRQQLFCCETRVESHEKVATAFSDHGLVWGPGRVHTAMSRLSFGRVELYLLEYGAEVEVRPRSFSDFLLVHFSLSGGIEVECGGHAVDRRIGEAFLFGQQPAVRMRWTSGARQLILKIPNEQLPEHVDRASFAVLTPMQSRQLGALVQALLCAAPNGMVQNHSYAWLDGLQSCLLHFIAQVLRFDGGGERSDERAREERGTSRDQRRVDRLLAYLKTHLAGRVVLDEMARAADLSPRGLHLLCQRHLGLTPMEILRDLRLEAARERLCQSPETPVTAIALDHGFGHLGRFSKYYRERFGELPVETRQRLEVAPSELTHYLRVPASAMRYADS